MNTTQSPDSSVSLHAPHPSASHGEPVANPSSANKKGGFPVLTILFLAAIASVAGWYFYGRSNASAAASSGGTPPPATVTVQTLTRQKIRLWNDFSGRLHAVNSAEIRPEVSGRIVDVRFHDGDSVKAGDVLIVIDPTPFEATVARAEARIASAKANLQYAVDNQARNDSLLKAKVIAQREFDQTNTANNAAAADLLAAQADLKTAQVDLDHAYIKAPISGRMSRAELTVGNLVQSGAGAPLLTSIVSEDGIYADFEVDEHTYLTTIRDSALGNSQEGQIPVELAVEGDTAAKLYPGFIQNFDNQLDTRTGTIRARAKFANTDGTLVPGMFVSVHLASSREHDVVLIPDRAIGFDQSKKFAFVVSADNKVAYREIELGRELGGKRVVLKGLDAGDRVVVDGVQRVRADAVVNPQEVSATEQPTVAKSTQHEGEAQ